MEPRSGQRYESPNGNLFEVVAITGKAIVMRSLAPGNNTRINIYKLDGWKIIFPRV